MGLGFLTFTLVALVGPGFAAQRMAKVRTDPALVLPLGVVLATAAYAIAYRCGANWLFPLLILLLDASLVLVPRQRWTGDSPPLRGALPPFLALLALFALTRYGLNRSGADGDFLLDPLVSWDTALHVGLTRELTLGYPPQVPMLAGVPLSYHFGADLLRAGALAWARVDPYDAISRGEPTLFALALVLLLRALSARLCASAAAVLLAPWALLAADFSFLFGALPKAHWWVDEFRGNLLLSLVLDNPVIPALILALGALVALSRAEAGEGHGWLVLAMLQAFAVAFFKAFTGAHLALALALAVLLAPSGRRRRVALVAVAPLIATAMLALSSAAQRVSVTLDPLDLVRATREGLGLPALSAAGLATWTPAWLLVSLGLRVFGFGPAFAALRKHGSAAAAAAGLALTGWPLGLLVRVSAEAAPGDPVINNANFFLEQGGLLLWVFTAIALVALAGRRRILVLTLAALVALPATLQFALAKARLAPDRLDAHIGAAMTALATVSRPGDVVLQRPGSRYPPPPVAFIGRRVPYERFSPFLAQFAPAATLRERHEAVLRFFRATDPDQALAAAQALNAAFLCLYDDDRVRFDPAALLSPVFESQEARCYRLLGVR